MMEAKEIGKGRKQHQSKKYQWWLQKHSEVLGIGLMTVHDSWLT